MKSAFFILPGLVFSLSAMQLSAQTGLPKAILTPKRGTETPVVIPLSHRYMPGIPEGVKVQPSVMLKKWSADDLPFFCKIEHKMGKNMSLPLKFRLGSVEYVDALEGK